jgi:hypothetical protein
MHRIGITDILEKLLRSSVCKTITILQDELHGREQELERMTLRWFNMPIIKNGQYADFIIPGRFLGRKTDLVLHDKYYRISSIGQIYIRYQGELWFISKLSVGKNVATGITKPYWDIP